MPYLFRLVWMVGNREDKHMFLGRVQFPKLIALSGQFRGRCSNPQTVLQEVQGIQRQTILAFRVGKAESGKGES